jgi:hypothetical protein
MDTDKNGVLDRREITVALQGLKKTEVQIQKLLKCIVHEVVDYAQFVALVSEPQTPQELRARKSSLTTPPKVPVQDLAIDESRTQDKTIFDAEIVESSAKPSKPAVQIAEPREDRSKSPRPRSPSQGKTDIKLGEEIAGSATKPLKPLEPPASPGARQRSESASGRARSHTKDKVQNESKPPATPRRETRPDKDSVSTYYKVTIGGDEPLQESNFESTKSRPRVTTRGGLEADAKRLSVQEGAESPSTLESAEASVDRRSERPVDKFKKRVSMLPQTQMSVQSLNGQPQASTNARPKLSRVGTEPFLPTASESTTTVEQTRSQRAHSLSEGAGSAEAAGVAKPVDRLRKRLSMMPGKQELPKNLLTDMSVATVPIEAPSTQVVSVADKGGNSGKKPAHQKRGSMLESYQTKAPEAAAPSRFRESLSELIESGGSLAEGNEDEDEDEDEDEVTNGRPTEVVQEQASVSQPIAPRPRRASDPLYVLETEDSVPRT